MFRHEQERSCRLHSSNKRQSSSHRYDSDKCPVTVAGSTSTFGTNDAGGDGKNGIGGLDGNGIEGE